MKLCLLLAFATISLAIALPIMESDDLLDIDFADFSNESDIDVLGGKNKKGGGITYTEWESASPYMIYEQVGYNSNGDAFSYYGGDDGSMLEKIAFYIHKKGVKGLKVWRTNGESESWGTMSGSYKEYSFDNGEIITKLSMWIGKKKKRICGIKMETNTGGSFEALCKKKYSQEYPIDLGSGVCVGVQGRSDSYINALGFVFVKELYSSEMSNVEYPDIGITDANVHTQSLKKVTYANTLDTEQTYTISDTLTKTTSENWGVSNTLTQAFSITIGVTAAVPELGSISVSSTYGITESNVHTHGLTETSTTTELHTFPIIVPAQTEVEVTLEVGRADISLSYTGTITLTTTDGNVLSFDISGEYEGVTYTEVTLDIEET